MNFFEVNMLVIIFIIISFFVHVYFASRNFREYWPNSRKYYIIINMQAKFEVKSIAFVVWILGWGGGGGMLKRNHGQPMHNKVKSTTFKFARDKNDVYNKE